MRFPPTPRDRTMSPHVKPTVRTIRCPGTYGVLTTIMPGTGA